jgi:putative transposase
MKQINEMVQILLKSLRQFVKVKYLTLDGHFGNNQAVLLARQNELELISKLRRDAVLFEKYEGEQARRGAKRKYGKRLRYDLLPLEYLQKSEREGNEIINYYAGEFWHKEFAGKLKVVIIVKIDVARQKSGHAILFSSDLELEWEKLVDYYRLRFQIEFNFRDAKQHFGLEDFMNQTEEGVRNASNLAFMMVLLSAKLLKNSPITTARGGGLILFALEGAPRPASLYLYRINYLVTFRLPSLCPLATAHIGESFLH